MLEIRLMGTPSVTVEQAPLEVDTRKAIAILAFVAVEGSASRDSLISMFWPESPTDRARSSLRRTLSALRSGTGGSYLAADRDLVELTGERRVDLELFHAELAATRDHGHDAGDVCRLCVPRLERATSLHRGDFMEGFSIRDAPDFEDWVRTTTEEIRLAIGDAFNRLAHGQAAEGDFFAAIVTVRRWIELDQLHEPAHRLLMLLHAWAGDRPGAIESYRRFVGVLDRELGVSPLEETTELYEAILDEDLPPPPGVRRRPRAAEAAPDIVARQFQPFEREAETRMLRNVWEEMSADGRVVAVSGASWMGKTRLLDEFSIWVGKGGGWILSAGASRTEMSLPFGLVGQLVAPLLKMVGAGSVVPDWVVGELARIDPRIAPGAATESDRFGQLRLFEAFHELLMLAAIERPLLLAVDDVQWADSSSASLLSFLSRRLEGLRVLMVLAGDSSEFFEPAIEELLGQVSAVIPLDSLTADSLVGRTGNIETAEAIVAATGGVPLLVLEALDGDGSGAREVARYVDERLREASNLGRQLLAATAVLGSGADSSLLREVSGRTELEVVDGIEELLAAGLLMEAKGAAAYAFTFDALSLRIYESTSLARKRLLHRRAAEALSARPWADSDARLAATIAAQYQGAGSPEAARWFKTAGDLSLQVYAHAAARRFYQDAIGVGGDESGVLHLAMAEAAIAHGDYPAAKRELSVASLQATGETLALVEHRLGEVHRLLGRFDMASESFARARRDHPRPAVLLGDWALLHHRRGEVAEARQKAGESLELAADGGPRQMAQSLNVAAIVATDAADAINALDRALDLAGEDEMVRMAALNNKAHWLNLEGRSEAAIRLLDDAIAVASRTGHRHREAALHNHLADVHHRAGDDGRAREALERAVVLFADVDAGTWEPELWLLRHW